MKTKNEVYFGISPLEQKRAFMAEISLLDEKGLKEKIASLRKVVKEQTEQVEALGQKILDAKKLKGTNYSQTYLQKTQKLEEVKNQLRYCKEELAMRKENEKEYFF